ncbi:sodium-dependent neutral amino acid transporter B(0)AT3-like [Ruditapes philippinarum]|uniref:sodium-dependent neutral amino acid transporter B(0)AT3-like n=1 Tax=Ruditapes philippinarum TaxID=129788 RepID=UPI00295BF546|nr:sodium-dependent neutral amino acid transporter B(0)AT3-like [Ruditapes philippinarum]
MDDNQDKVEMTNLVSPHSNVGNDHLRDGGPHENQALNLPSPPSNSYGSTLGGSMLSINPEASTVNLLKIDLEKKIDRHTGEERDMWDSRAEFLLSLIGYAVGLGNVWRFPYLTQKNGGGAFLIPYAVMIIIEGVPLFYLELAVGQRLRKGAVGSWNQVSPYLGGIGLASAAVSFNVALYYNTIMAWCILYLVQSFQDPLPWSTCPSVQHGNITVVDDECQRSGPTTYFWYRETLQISPDIESTPGFNLKLAAALLASWILVYLCMIKGIKSSGKVVYVTATFPYFVLVIFFFRGVTLPGFEKGLEYLFIPEWSRLADPAVWLDAATQIFYSFGLAFGCLIALSSYNPVRSNFVKEALIVSVTDFFTSIFTAVVVFSILGFKATMAFEECVSKHSENQTLHAGQTAGTGNTSCDFKEFLEGSASGTGLAFIVFTEAINQFPIAQLWSVLFFLMLLTLGLDSMFGTLEGALTSINDMMMFPGLRKEILVGITCLVSFLVSLAFASTTGPYVFDLYDSYCANIPLLVIAFMECVAISYKYGLKQFSDDIEMMVGHRPHYFWLICWRYVGPLAMMGILAASLVEIVNKGTPYEIWDSLKGTTILVQWPWWCQVLAALLILMSTLWIPGVALFKYFNIVQWKEEIPAFFPSDELREERNIKEKESNWFEKYILGFKS